MKQIVGLFILTKQGQGLPLPCESGAAAGVAPVVISIKSTITRKQEDTMIRFITILTAVGAVIYMVRWYREQKRLENAGRMTPDELVEAIIRRQISVLEVPPEHRDAVNEMLREIQSELDKI